MPAPAAAVPPGGPGVCRHCRGPLPLAPTPRSPGPATCPRCARTAGALTGWPGERQGRAVRVVPIAIAVSGGELAGALWRYKAPASGEARSAGAADGLAALLGRFLRAHLGCLGAGAGTPDAITHVPDARPGRHLARLLAAAASGQAGPGEPSSLLAAGTSARRCHPHRFRCPLDLAGASVVLVDDTWTTGATALSAAAALLRAGAGEVTVVVLGRHVAPGDPGAQMYLRRLAEGPRWTPDRCAVHLPQAAGAIC